MIELLKPSKIVYSKRKTISLVIKPGGEFVVRSPKNIDLKRIFEFIQIKQEWIIKTKEKLILKAEENQVFNGQNGETFPFLGDQIKIVSNLTQTKNCIFDPINLVLTVNSDQLLAKKIVLDWLSKQARVILNEELKYWSQNMKLFPTKFRLSSAKTRWGSCSGKNVVSLNWRLVLSPKEVLQYVVIHELAHIKQKNHSKNFWDLVNLFDPDFKNHRKHLKTDGRGLMSRFS